MTSERTYEVPRRALSPESVRQLQTIPRVVYMSLHGAARSPTSEQHTLFDRDRAPRLTRRAGGGGEFGANEARGGGGGEFGANEARGGGGGGWRERGARGGFGALTRRAGGGGGVWRERGARGGGGVWRANEARGGGGGFGANEARGGGLAR